MDKITGDYNLIRQKVVAHDYLGIYTNIDIIMHANFEYIHEIDMSGEMQWENRHVAMIIYTDVYERRAVMANLNRPNIFRLLQQHI